MAVDASIYNAFIKPIRSVDEYRADALAVEGSRQTNALRALTLQQGQRSMQDADRTRGEQEGARNALAALGGGATAAQRGNALRALGTQTGSAQADALDAADLERQKTTVEIDGKRATAGQTEFDTRKARLVFVMQGLATVGNAEQAKDYLAAGAHRGDIDQATAERMAADIPADPAAFEDWRLQGLRAGLDPKQQMEFTAPDANAVLSARTSTANATAAAQTSAANSAASNARQAAEGEANRTNARTIAQMPARSSATGPAAKPIPATAMRLIKDDLDAIGTFAGVDADIAGIAQQIAGGKLGFGPVSNIVNRGRNAVGASTGESRNFATFQAKLENMRNAVLLLNRGVQTEGDAQRAMAEMLANINDTGVVKQRLAEIRALNRRAVALKKANVDHVRSNYGHEPMDFGRFDAQPAATNLPSPGGPTPPPASGGLSPAEQAELDALRKRFPGAR